MVLTIIEAPMMRTSQASSTRAWPRVRVTIMLVPGPEANTW